MRCTARQVEANMTDQWPERALGTPWIYAIEREDIFEELRDLIDLGGYDGSEEE